MSDTPRDPTVSCPGCGAPAEVEWVACPYCGESLKPRPGMLWRGVAWLGVLLIFILGAVSISMQDRDAATMYYVVFGLPLSYVFGKAVLLRILGRPLTASQLTYTSLRTAAVAFGLLIVLPVLVGLSLLIFALVICSAMLVGGR